MNQHPAKMERKRLPPIKLPRDDIRDSIYKVKPVYHKLQGTPIRAGPCKGQDTWLDKSPAKKDIKVTTGKYTIVRKADNNIDVISRRLRRESYFAHICSITTHSRNDYGVPVNAGGRIKSINSAKKNIEQKEDLNLAIFNDGKNLLTTSTRNSSLNSVSEHKGQYRLNQTSLSYINMRISTSNRTIKPSKENIDEVDLRSSAMSETVYKKLRPRRIKNLFEKCFLKF